MVASTKKQGEGVGYVFGGGTFAQPRLWNHYTIKLAFRQVVWRFVIKAQRAGLTALVSIEITGAYAALRFEFCLLDKSGEFSRRGGALGAVLHMWWRSLDYPSNIAPCLYTRNPFRHLNPLYKSSENPSNPIRVPYQTSIGAPFWAIYP